MIETSVRHPRLIALLAGLVAVVAAVSLIGPRGSSVVGVSDAGADDGGETTVVSESTSTTVTDDDGVVLTAPGELVSVIEGPTSTSAGTGNVGVAGTPPGSTAAPSTSGPPAATGDVSATTTSVSQPAEPSSTTVSSTDETSPTQPSTTVSTTPDASGSATSGTAVEAAAVVDDPARALLAAPEMAGSTRGSDQPVSADGLVAQIGTRDTNSVPWMLLIAANFGIAIFALVLLRLRR